MKAVDTFRKETFFLDILGFYETRLKGNGIFEWDGVTDVKLDLQDDTDWHAREGVTLLLKDEWFKNV